MTRHITHQEVYDAAGRVAADIRSQFEWANGDARLKLYGVPRGGVPAAYLVQMRLGEMGEWVCDLVDDPAEADVIVDDLVDSGKTMLAHAQYNAPFYALFHKNDAAEWLVFPWEGTVQRSAEDIPQRLLQFIGEDPYREGLAGTPRRFLAAWEYWTGGYKESYADLFTSFQDGAKDVDEMVFVGNIPFVSHCEHHLAQFTGLVHVAYVPKGRILGLSKIPRLVDILARRLQVQERLTTQVATILSEGVNAEGVGVVVVADHSCISSRGIKKHGVITTTSKLLGCFKDDPSCRSEFLQFVQLTRR